ncbi:MAG: DUF868 family protein, partial [Synergistaceae bacterium]|nr:DUF868 family protein [Synergistaceae bacterium]
SLCHGLFSFQPAAGASPREKTFMSPIAEQETGKQNSAEFAFYGLQTASLGASLLIHAWPEK